MNKYQVIMCITSEAIKKIIIRRKKLYIMKILDFVNEYITVKAIINFLLKKSMYCTYIVYYTIAALIKRISRINVATL